MAAASVLPVTPTPATMPTAKPAPNITLLVTTFPGLGLPRTLSIPLCPSTSASDALASVHARLPASEISHSLLISTTSGKILRESDDEPITTLLSGPSADFLPLRINARLCGGKGGFGSQLRAAGGRMSSRKNRDRQQDTNGSNRNLDGRRLRTVDQAKRLAEYLATKPENDKKEKEEKRKRWEEVIASAEATEEKIRAGKMGSNGGRLDAEYVESKEAAEEKVREAVAKAMREQMLVDGPTGSESSAEDGGSQDEEEDESSSGQGDAAGPSKDAGSRSFFGWDEDDEFLSDDEDDDDEPAAQNEEPTDVSSKGKGKAKVS